MEEQLIEKAKKRFGEKRAAELHADLVKTAADLAAMASFPLTIDNEP